jgi:hypothetical protein
MPSLEAVHEAGHVVACHIYGVGFTHVTVDPQECLEGSIGGVWTIQSRDVLADLDVTFAGGEAVRVFYNTEEVRLDESDDTILAGEMFLRYVDNDLESFLDYWTSRRPVVSDLLRQNWDAVLSVAYMLDERKTLCEHQARVAILQAEREAGRCDLPDYTPPEICEICHYPKEGSPPKDARRGLTQYRSNTRKEWGISGQEERR